MIEQEKIDRINQLARKAKAQGLTPQEQAERESLRAQYRAAMRANLEAQLNSILIQEPDGTRHKLPRKE
jgi:uncharacterized protein YnzC (UPF0291/DUF896 family)